MPAQESQDGTLDLRDAREPGERVGRRVDVVPGVYYYAWAVTEDENPLFVQVRANWEKLSSAWSLRSWLLRRGLKEDWERLSSRQQELLEQARELDAAWRSLGVEPRADAFKERWNTLAEDWRAWDSDASRYSARCEGRAVDAAGCTALYRRLTAEVKRLEQRGQEIEKEWAATANDANRHVVSAEEYSRRVKEWQEDLVEFNADLQQEGKLWAASQTNEVLDQAREEARRTGRDVCQVLEEWLREATASGDTQRRLKIVQAQKFAGCRNRKKREEVR